MTDVPYVKLTLLPEMDTVDEDGYHHMPLAIESWPPGLNVERLLEYALNAIREEVEDG